jgi:hypothetical protein
VELPVTFWYYSGFGTKLSPIFGFAKSSQIQDNLSIKPNAQIRCSGCYAGVVFSRNYILNVFLLRFSSFCFNASNFSTSIFQTSSDKFQAIGFFISILFFRFFCND